MNRRNTKKMIAISAACVLSAALITGCGSKKDPYAMVEYDVKEYVTLGTYTGLKVDEKITAVTDKDVQAAIDSLVEELMSKNHLNGTEINAVLSNGGLKTVEK